METHATVWASEVPTNLHPPSPTATGSLPNHAGCAVTVEYHGGTLTTWSRRPPDPSPTPLFPNTNNEQTSQSAKRSEHAPFRIGHQAHARECPTAGCPRKSLTLGGRAHRHRQRSHHLSDGRVERGAKHTCICKPHTAQTRHVPRLVQGTRVNRTTCCNWWGERRPQTRTTHAP